MSRSRKYVEGDSSFSLNKNSTYVPSHLRKYQKYLNNKSSVGNNTSLYQMLKSPVIKGNISNRF